ncbi:hypothetical protein SHAb15599_00156 [Acinetobacter phage SH-Ab 15599]|nr:hypothetical protein SHAb15599_00156 [Acinetobacter phage SH-Ab 15599]
MSRKELPLYCGDHIGIVEDLMDPKECGRVRVRIFGIHSLNPAEVPKEKLPWCTIAVPATNPFVSGLGTAPLGLLEGSLVRLRPKSSNDFQEWEVQFTIAGQRNNLIDPSVPFPNGTDHDVNPLARGIVTSSDVYAQKDANAISGDIDGANNPNDTQISPEELKNYPWLAVAISQLGVDERDNPAQIREYHAKGGGSSKWGGETPWCASFVGWCLQKVGIKGSGSAAARSYTRYGKSTLNQKPIPPGSICVIAGNRGASSGHVFFCEYEKDGRIHAVGGNQSAKNKQNGGEVTRTTFARSSLIAAVFPDVANLKAK